MEVKDWLKNNINGQIACKMLEIVAPRGEHIYMCDDFDHSIKYQGREFNVGLIVTGVEVGDIPDDDDYTYVVYLGDFAVCKEFRDATIKLQKERGFSIELSDDICFTDCVLALGEEYKDLGNAISKINSALRKYKHIKHSGLDDFIHGLCKLSLPYSYNVEIKYERLYLNVHNPIAKWDLINKKPSYIEVMETIKKYFEVSDVDEILKLPRNAILDEKLGAVVKEQEREEENKKDPYYFLIYIYIEDGLKIIERKIIDLKEIARQLHYNTDDEWEEFRRRACSEMNKIFLPEYRVGYDYKNQRFPIFENVVGSCLRNKYHFWNELLFKDKMQKVADYLETLNQKGF